MEPTETPSRSTASTWKRLFAWWLDGVPLLVLLMAGTAPTLLRGYFHESWAMLAAAWCVTLCYQICFLYYYGATPGKLLYRLKVVSIRGNGDELSISQAVIRALVSIVLPNFVSILPQAIAFFRSDRRQLADLMAGTRVVQEAQRPSPARGRPVLGGLLVLGALVSACTTLASLANYQFSADGVRYDFRLDDR